MNKNMECKQELIEDCAKKLKVLGHPVRLKLLCLIANHDDPCVSKLWQCLQQPQPVVSQHLSVLKENGIVTAEAQSTKRNYSITDPFIKNIIDALLKEMTHK